MIIEYPDHEKSFNGEGYYIEFGNRNNDTDHQLLVELRFGPFDLPPVWVENMLMVYPVTEYPDLRVMAAASHNNTFVPNSTIPTMKKKRVYGSESAAGGFLVVRVVHHQSKPILTEDVEPEIDPRAAAEIRSNVERSVERPSWKECDACGGSGRVTLGTGKWHIMWRFQDGSEWCNQSFDSESEAVFHAKETLKRDGSLMAEIYNPAGVHCRNGSRK